MNNITALAKTLGIALAEHSRTQDLLVAQTVVNNDNNADALVQKFKTQLETMQSYEAKGQQVAPEQKDKLEQIRTEISNNPALAELTKRQVAFVEMMKTVKTTIDSHLGDLRAELGLDVRTEPPSGSERIVFVLAAIAALAANAGPLLAGVAALWWWLVQV